MGPKASFYMGRENSINPLLLLVLAYNQTTTTTTTKTRLLLTWKTASSPTFGCQKRHQINTIIWLKKARNTYIRHIHLTITYLHEPNRYTNLYLRCGVLILIGYCKLHFWIFKCCRLVGMESNWNSFEIRSIRKFAIRFIQ